MSSVERRLGILGVLCHRGYDTCKNLANEFGVSERTIRRDISELTCSYPVEAVRGRGGGVKMVGDYPRRQHYQRLTPKQEALLRRLGDQLTGEDLETLNSILLQLAP